MINEQDLNQLGLLKKKSTMKSAQIEILIIERKRNTEEERKVSDSIKGNVKV